MKELLSARKIFKMLEEAYKLNPTYSTMRHIAMQMYCEGFKVGSEQGRQLIADVKEKADAEMLVDESFLVFWELYDKKEGKTLALRTWRRLSKEERQCALIHAPIYVKATPVKKYRKNPATYLNQRVWLDEEVPEPYEDREIARRRRTGEAEELASQLAHFRLDK